ncbi:MAG TPA: RluA family pseudouridine synthase [Kofleriaceae bacterium]|nr:RluA family pseudouridine synthase [Kofleriaceae bacterium]
MPSPFGPPHDAAVAAARELMRRLPVPREGKMFGVLVVDDGAVLAAFSGMLDGRWHTDGFVPPAFDSAARDAFWPAGEAELGRIEAEIRALDPERAAVAAELAREEAELEALRVRHRERREARRLLRGDPTLAHALDQESRGDTAERKRFDAAHKPVRDELLARARQIADAQARLAALRAERSRHFLHRLQDTYAFPLRALFAPAEPPGGAGDCAAPKLVAHALRHGMRPRALAEFWWGPPPPTGDRVHGQFYPACRGKCLPILTHLLDGIAEPPPVWEQQQGELRTLHEDAHVIVASKPAGLLSNPGRSTRDSVQTRLGATAVHRLDLDTSGVLLLAKDPGTLAALQRQFEKREVEKRYIAWLAGEVAGDAGTIALPLRGDLDDRPRQIVDEVHGRPALTEWRVLAREGGRTRVAFVPKTGRAHQLRVHAAHPRGLATPIVGDRLYGTSAARLMLHAEFLAFIHPHTGQRMELADLSPF